MGTPIFPYYDLGIVARTPAMSGFPTLELLGPITPVNRISWSDELVGDGQARVGVNNDSIIPIIGNRLADLGKFPCELWIWRNSKLVFAGLIVGLLTKGNTSTVISQGLLYYLRFMNIFMDYKGDFDQYTIIKDLIDMWQDEEYGNFGINTANIGTSGVNTKVDFEADELPNTRQEIEELSQEIGGFDYYIDLSTSTLGADASRDFKCGARGSDKSNRIIVDHRNLSATTVLYQSVAVNDIATWVKVIGTSKSTIRRGTRTNPDLLTKFGRAAAVHVIDKVQAQSTVDDASQRLINELSETHIEVGGEKQNAAVFSVPDITPEDVDPGDTVSVIWDVGFSIIEQERVIYRKYVSVDASGEERMTLEFV